MTRVYLSVDMEGVAGISHAKPTARGEYGYERAAQLMLGEANAAIEGAFAGGATDVTVNDSHGQMYNLSPEALDPRARYVTGTKPYSMVEAARDASFDLAMFVGYHARAGDPRGVIAHTYKGSMVRVSINDRPVTEAAVNGLYLGALGVPVGLITGDDALALDMKLWFPWAELVVVKRAVSYQAAESVHPARAQELIRDGARRAVENAVRPGSPLQPLTMDPPLTLRIDFTNAGQADMAAVIPSFDRVDDRAVTYTTDDMVTLFRAFMSAWRIARVADD